MTFNRRIKNKDDFLRRLNIFMHLPNIILECHYMGSKQTAVSCIITNIFTESSPAEAKTNCSGGNFQPVLFLLYK